MVAAHFPKGASKRVCCPDCSVFDAQQAFMARIHVVLKHNPWSWCLLMFEPHQQLNVIHVWLLNSSAARMPSHARTLATHVYKQPPLPHTRTDHPSGDCRLKVTGAAQRPHMLAVLTPSTPRVSSVQFIPDRPAPERQQFCYRMHAHARAHAKVPSSNCWGSDLETSMWVSAALCLCGPAGLLLNWGHSPCEVHQLFVWVFNSARFPLLSQTVESVAVASCWSEWDRPQNENQACGHPQHPEASVTYLTSSTQTRWSSIDLTEWRKTLINFPFTWLPNQIEINA